jgi:hypothetical protein
VRTAQLTQLEHGEALSCSPSEHAFEPVNFLGQCKTTGAVDSSAPPLFVAKSRSVANAPPPHEYCAEGEILLHRLNRNLKSAPPPTTAKSPMTVAVIGPQLPDEQAPKPRSKTPQPPAGASMVHYQHGSSFTEPQTPQIVYAASVPGDAQTTTASLVSDEACVSSAAFMNTPFTPAFEVDSGASTEMERAMQATLATLGAVPPAVLQAAAAKVAAQ